MSNDIPEDGASDPSHQRVNLIYAEQHFEAARERAEFSLRIALETLRTLVVANGGGILGIIAFLGHFADRISSLPLWSAFVSFSLGLALAILAFILAQLSQDRHHAADWAKASHTYLMLVGRTNEAPPKLEANASAAGKADLLSTQSNLVAAGSLLLFLFGASAAALALVRVG